MWMFYLSHFEWVTLVPFSGFSDPAIEQRRCKLMTYYKSDYIATEYIIAKVHYHLYNTLVK